MKKYSLSDQRLRAANYFRPPGWSEFRSAILATFSAKFSWCNDFDGSGDYLPGAVVLRSDTSMEAHEQDEPYESAELIPEVLEQFRSRPFASCMQIDYNGKPYVLANIEWFCFMRSEDRASNDHMLVGMMRMLEAEAIGKPLPQEVVDRIHEIVIFPKEMLLP